MKMKMPPPLKCMGCKKDIVGVDIPLYDDGACHQNCLFKRSNPDGVPPAALKSFLFFYFIFFYFFNQLRIACGRCSETKKKEKDRFDGCFGAAQSFFLISIFSSIFYKVVTIKAQLINDNRMRFYNALKS
jgi:hypothetical protein